MNTLKHSFFTPSCALFMALLEIALGSTDVSPALAAVITTGSISDDGSYYYIGYTADGTLNINEASVLSRTVGYLGYNSGCTGTVMVSGTGATWSNSSYLYIGDSGNGTLYVESGGLLSGESCYIGHGTKSTGTVKVTGTGSTWVNGLLNVGYNGIGTVNVESGGQLSSTSCDIGYSSLSTGTVTVTGTGSMWADTGYTLSVGSFGNGTLNIESGGQVSTSCGHLGYYAHSTGTATVNGIGSKWSTGSDLYIGNIGSGTLNIESGGQISTPTGYLGYSLGANGIATVNGTGSIWTNSSDLYVGYNGDGTLTVENGGSVVTQTLYASLGNLFGNGNITAKGAILDSALVFDGSHGLSQSLTFGASGALNLNIDGTGALGAGHKGVGTLRIADGMHVVSSNGMLGNTAGSTGTATVSGTGSIWTSNSLQIGTCGTGTLIIESGGHVSSSTGYVGYRSSSSIGAVKVTGTGSIWINSSDLYVGYNGDGTLTVENGGSVVTQTLYASLGNLFGNGNITAKGAILDSALVFDGSHGLSQSLTFGASGALNLNIDGTGALGAGHKGVGTLRIADGMHVVSSNGMLGNTAGSTGTATVTGTESTWNNGLLFIGFNGTGTLNIESGGQVSSSIGYVGYISSSSIGAVKVTGTGSTWTNGQIIVGNTGSGRLNIEAGGKVVSTVGFIGQISGYSMAKVMGAGSKWTNKGDLSVGGSGSGTLTIADSGNVSSNSINVINKSTIKLQVSGNDMIIVGGATTTGSFINNGKVNLYGDAFLSPATYMPISEYAGRAISWSGRGTYNTFGGTWDNTAKTFTVAAPVAANAGVVNTIATGERLLITDQATGKHAGASFGAVTGTTTFSAMLMSDGDLTPLRSTPGFAGTVLTAWNYTTNLSGGTEVMLSFDLGLGYQDPQVWHLSGGTWSLYTPDLATYDSQGNFSFTVTSFSGYAVSAVPEPCTLAMLGISVIGLLVCAWRRRKRIS
jgi:fibronectin-binding autotransporter adhesin